MLSALVGVGLALAMPRAGGAVEPPALTAATVPYYIAEGGETRGPVGLDVLIGEIREGAVLPWTLVWKPGLSGWIKAGALPELGDALSTATPRPPPPPPQPPAIPAETVYFIAESEGTRGPLSEAEVVAAIEAGEVTAATLVWWPGAADWLAAGSAPGLADRFAVAPPAVPPTEAIRQMLVGAWAFSPRVPDAIGVRTVLTFAPDMTFSGTVAVTLEGVAPETRQIGGTWAVEDVGEGRFGLVLTPTDGRAGVTRLRIVGHDTLATEDDGTTAHRIPG